MVVGCLDVTVEAAADAEFHVGALIGQRVTRVHTHKTALGIHAVEGSLRTAKDVDALQLIGVEVHLTLADEGYAVDVHSDDGAVDARTDTTYIDGGGVARTVVGHNERRNIGRELAEVANA